MMKHFVTSSSDSLISEFTQSPSTRVKLVSDLQQLNAFLTSRKRELSSRVGSGRDVIEVIVIALLLHLLVTTLVMLHRTTWHSTVAVQNVLEQIVGDGVQAR